MTAATAFSSWLANDANPADYDDAIKDYVTCMHGIDECHELMARTVKYARLFPKAGTREIMSMIMEDHRDDTNIADDLKTEFEQGRL